MAARVARQARIFFFCGPDDAGVQDAATRIASLLEDPGERIELAGADLRKDPVRLGDEARSTSLFGGTRHIWIRAQGDEAHDAIANLIESEVEPCPVLIVATGATDKSKTAKLLAARPDSLVAMFWPPDQGTVTSAVRTMAGVAGLRMGSEIAERIAVGAGLDTRVARSEIDKLSLYLDASPESPRPVDARDLDAIGAQTGDDDFTSLVDAVLGGKRETIAPEIRRLRDQGMNPVGLLLAFERRAAQLAALASRFGGSGELDAFLQRESDARRIFWREKAVLGVQMRKWRGHRLERLAARLVGLHQTLLANSQDAELLLAQGLAEIARMQQSANR